VRESSRRRTASQPTPTSRCRGTAQRGFICAFFATVMGFALIRPIWWMVRLAVVGAYTSFVAFARRDQDEYIVPDIVALPGPRDAALIRITPSSKIHPDSRRPLPLSSHNAIWVSSSDTSVTAQAVAWFRGPPHSADWARPDRHPPGPAPNPDAPRTGRRRGHRVPTVSASPAPPLRSCCRRTDDSSRSESGRPPRHD
jgi:hypothetical protein